MFDNTLSVLHYLHEGCYRTVSTCCTHSLHKYNNANKNLTGNEMSESSHHASLPGNNNNNNNNNNKRQFVRCRNMSVDITRAPYRQSGNVVRDSSTETML